VAPASGAPAGTFEATLRHRARGRLTRAPTTKAAA
jgi:hypothetical protein